MSGLKAATFPLRNGSSLETAIAPADNPALRRFAVATAAATFALVWMGGLVTSHEAGLAVPDWPNTYGYNLFFFPVSKWLGGIFFEHVHRLVASGVGLLTTILALWLFGRKSRPLLRWGGAVLLLAGLVALFCNVQSAIRNGGGRPDRPDRTDQSDQSDRTIGNRQSAIGNPQSAIGNPQSPTPGHLGECLLLAAIGATSLAASFIWPKSEPSPAWLRRLGVLAFFAVVVQGILGGLRVTLLQDQLGIFHATLAQLFFVLMSAIALFHTAFWRNLPARAGVGAKGLRCFFLAATLVILGQLTLGATMRHQHAGLAIPDFPAAYGKIWPDTSPAAILRYNRRVEVEGYAPITAFQIVLQMVHRLVAGMIFLMVGACAWLAWRRLGPRHPLSRLACGWLLLIVAQIFLGAATIWTGKKADIATAHVACGALSLMMGGLISMISCRCLAAPAAQNGGADRFLDRH